MVNVSLVVQCVMMVMSGVWWFNVWCTVVVVVVQCVVYGGGGSMYGSGGGESLSPTGSHPLLSPSST